MFHISNLHDSGGEKPILKGLTLAVPAAVVHPIMGLDRGIIEKSGLILSSGTF